MAEAGIEQFINPDKIRTPFVWYNSIVMYMFKAILSQHFNEGIALESNPLVGEMQQTIITAGELVSCLTNWAVWQVAIL